MLFMGLNNDDSWLIHGLPEEELEQAVSTVRGLSGGFLSLWPDSGIAQVLHSRQVRTNEFFCSPV